MIFNQDFIKYKPIFTEDELNFLDEYNSLLPLKKFLQNKNLKEKFGFDFIYTNALIEGTTYSKADAITLLDFIITAGGKKYKEAKMFLNLKKGFEFILNDDCNINKFKIRQIYSILADDLVDNVGSARKRGVLIKGSDYIPLNEPISLKSELDNILTIYNTIKNPYEKALYLHNNLVYLQYFSDVNKQTARTILNLSLICEDKMILIPQDEFISIYIEGIIDYYEINNSDKIKDFFLKSNIKILKVY